MNIFKLYIKELNYKFIIAFFFLSMVISENSHSQSLTENINLGIISGANVGSLISSNDRRMSVRATYMIGFLAEYEFKERLHFQTEILYSRQGENNRGRRDIDRFRDLLSLDYVALPIMAKYKLFDRFWAESGLQVAYLIHAETDQVQGSQSFTQSVKRNYKDWDVLYNLGVSYKSDWSFFIGLRYSLGLTNILQNPMDDLTSQRHSVYQFNFGYTF